jgi:uncharacterized membrane protein HdeD (DUF308 family)
VAFGLLAIFWPQVTLTRLVILFGVYALAHGILTIAAAIGSRGQPGCLLLGLEGTIGLLAGIITLRSASPTPMAFVFLVWLWAIATGVLRIGEAIRLRKEISGDLWLALSGVVTVFLGLMLFSQRIIGGVVGLAILIAVFAVIWGVLEILLGWEMRAVRHRRPIRGS